MINCYDFLILFVVFLFVVLYFFCLVCTFFMINGSRESSVQAKIEEKKIGKWRKTFIVLFCLRGAEVENGGDFFEVV